MPHNMFLFCTASCLLATSATASEAPMPHIVFLFCDNVGWSNLGYHRSVPTKEVVTPNIDALARTGLELDRMYTYKFCSPSRSSLLTGRLPMHVNIYNSNPAQPGAGIPIGMTLISEKLTSVGTMCSARCVCTHMLTHLFSHCLSSLSVGSVPGRV